MMLTKINFSLCLILQVYRFEQKFNVLFEKEKSDCSA